MKQKDDNTFIAVVKESGSRDATWHGSLSHDSKNGYSGKLFSPSIYARDFADLVEAGKPAELSKKHLYCLLNGSDYATIIRPRFTGGWQIKTAGSKMVDLNIRSLIHKVHIDHEEEAITQIILSGDIFAQFSDLKGITEDVSFNPFRARVDTVLPEEISFETDIGVIKFKIQHSMAERRRHLQSSVSATGQLRLLFPKSRSVSDAIKTLNLVESLISVICFDLVRAKVVIFCTETTSDGNAETIDCLYERALGLAKVSSNIDPKKLPLKLSDIDFGKVFNKFCAIHSELERTLSWYRIVAGEVRYIEDKYFYAVRMIDSFFSNFRERVSDKGALLKIDEIDGLLDKVGRNDLKEFTKLRVRPTFTRSASISESIRQIKKDYADIPAAELLDETLTRRLRGREAHGSTTPYSQAQIEYMNFAFEFLKDIFACLVLEECGVSRNVLINGLRNSTEHFGYFSEHHVGKLREALK